MNERVILCSKCGEEIGRGYDDGTMDLSHIEVSEPYARFKEFVQRVKDHR